MKKWKAFQRMQAAPVGRGGYSGVDRVFRDVKFREVGDLRVGRDGPQAWMLKSHTHYSTSLLCSPHPPSHFLTSSEVWVERKNEPDVKICLNVGWCVSQLA